LLDLGQELLDGQLGESLRHHRLEQPGHLKLDLWFDLLNNPS